MRCQPTSTRLDWTQQSVDGGSRGLTKPYKRPPASSAVLIFAQTTQPSQPCGRSTWLSRGMCRDAHPRGVSSNLVICSPHLVLALSCRSPETSDAGVHMHLRGTVFSSRLNLRGAAPLRPRMCRIIISSMRRVSGPLAQVSHVFSWALGQGKEGVVVVLEQASPRYSVLHKAYDSWTLQCAR